MLLQLIGSTYYFMGVYARLIFFCYNEEGGGGGGKATKGVIRNEELGTY